MLEVRIVKEIRKSKKRDVIVFNLLAPKNEINSSSKIVANSPLSSNSLYSYALIHCKRLGLDHFFDGDQKINLSSLENKRNKNENT
jgi:hypothetical protein